MTTQKPWDYGGKTRQQRSYGAPQSILDAHGLDRKHEPGGLVVGKRCGTSQNIAAKARLDGETP